MLRYEWKKMLWYRRGIVYICLFLAVKLVMLCFLGDTGNDALEQNREAYDAYMEQVEGELTEEKREYLEAESTRLAEAKLALSQVQQSYYSGGISKEEYQEQSSALEADLAMQAGFDQVFSQYIYVRAEPEERYLLYTGGWDGILSAQNADYLGILLLLLLIVPVFCQEYSCGMDQLLVTSGRGARSQVGSKVAVCVLTAAAVGVVGLLMEYAWYGIRYGLPCGQFPIQSLENYQTVEKNLSLRGAFLLQAGMRLFGYVYCAVILLFVSACARRLAASLAASTAVTVIPFLMVENYNSFTRIPGPWGPLVGTVFLSGSVTSWNTYWQREEVVSTELGWGAWAAILTAALCLMGLMIAVIRRRNRNVWLTRAGNQRKGSGVGRTLLCAIACLAVGLLSGCGQSAGGEPEASSYIYNSEGYLWGETEDYLFYIDESNDLDGILIGVDKETGERFQAERDALYDGTGEGGLAGTMELTVSVFAAGRYAFYFRTLYTEEYWNSDHSLDTFEVVRLDTEDFSEEVLYELDGSAALGSLYGFRQFFVDGEELYLVDESGSGIVYRMDPRSGALEPVISQGAGKNVAWDGRYLYYLSVAGLLNVYDTETEETQEFDDVVAYNFWLHEDGVYYLNLRDNKCIYRWDPETGQITKLGDTRTLWLECDASYIYFVDEENWQLYRMDKDGQNVVLMSEEYPVLLYVFEGSDWIYLTVYRNETYELLQMNKHTLEMREVE